jgi:CheY-like chemotaxis protein
MKNILVCSSNPLLIKSLYGMLRDQGCNVDVVEHPAFAVQKVIETHYDSLIFDSEPFGLSAEDAAEIIEAVNPSLPILFLGSEGKQAWQTVVRKPVDLEELQRVIHSIAV